MMWIEFCLKLMVCILEIGIGTYVLFKAKRVYSVWLFFLSSLFLGLWLASKAIYSVEIYFRDPLIDNLILFFGAYMSAFTYLFILSFPTNYLPRVVHKGCSVFILSIYTMLAFAASLSGISHELMANGIYQPVAARFPFVMSIYSSIQIVSVGLCFIYWIYSYRKAFRSEDKKLIIFTALAFILGRMGPGILFNLFLVSRGNYSFIDVIFLTSLVWQLTFFYVICYRKAFEFRTAIHYTVFWVLVSGLFIVPCVVFIKASLYV